MTMESFRSKAIDLLENIWTFQSTEFPKMTLGRADCHALNMLCLRNELFASYLIRLLEIIALKLQGRSLKDSTAVAKLIELRVTLERSQPLQNRLQYQIDKLANFALKPSQEQLNETNEILHRPNLDDFENASSGSDSEQVREDVAAEDSRRLFRVRKLAATKMADDKTGNNDDEIRAQIKSTLSRAAISEYLQSTSALPDEQSHRAVRRTAAVEAEKLKERYEEEHYMRFPVTKKDRQAKESVFHDLEELNLFPGKPSAKKAKKLPKLTKKQERRLRKRRLKRTKKLR